jgi:hypothetical protein
MYKDEDQSGIKLKQSLENLIFINNQYKAWLSTEEDIFPIDFFRSYISSLDAQTDFYKKIDLENALKYSESLITLNESYNKDANKIRNQIESWIKKLWLKSDSKIWQEDNYITADIIIGDLQKISANSKILKGILDYRKKCLLDADESCDISNQDYEKLPAETNKDFSQPNLFASKFNSWATLKISSKCWPDKKVYMEIENKCPSYFNYCFYNTDLRDSKSYTPVNPRYVFDAALADKGVKIIPKNPTTPYSCNDYEYQQRATSYYCFINDVILRNNDSLKLIEDKNYSKEITAGLIYIDNLQNNLKTWEFYDEDDFKRLIIYYSNIQSHFLNDIKINKENIGDFNLINERLNLLRSNLSNFYLVLNKVVIHDSNNIISSKLLKVKDNNLKTKDLYVFFSRNNYSLFFMNASPLIWKSKDKPVYNMPLGNNTARNSAHLDQTDAENKYWIENVDNWTKIFYESDKMFFYSKFYKEYGFDRFLAK